MSINITYETAIRLPRDAADNDLIATVRHVASSRGWVEGVNEPWGDEETAYPEVEISLSRMRSGGPWVVLTTEGQPPTLLRDMIVRELVLGRSEDD